MADYVIAGNAAVDKITFADGTSTGFMPGGATLFALTGIQLWTDSVLMCGGFGADYMEHMGDWMERNHIDRRGFHVRDPKNPLNYLVYRDSGDWYSYTEYGNVHYESLDCDPQKDHLREFLKGTKGVYCFRADDLDFFGQMAQLRKEFGFRFMWEIKATITVPEKLPVIRRILKNTDAFSINRREAYRLFEVEEDSEAIRALQGLDVPMVVYRIGSRGLYIIKGEEVFFAPSFQKYSVVDVTGCGNSSTAAAFYAWCENMDVCGIAAAANITAGMNLRYQGAMELTPENKRIAREEKKELENRYRKGSMEAGIV